MRDSSGAHDDELDRNAARDVREFRRRARSVVALVRDSSPPRLAHVGDTAIAPVESFGEVVPALAPSGHDERPQTIRDAWSTACSPPQRHDYGCAACGVALSPFPARDWAGRDMCNPCHARITLPPPHLRFTERPIPGGLLLRWRLGAAENWRRFQRDFVAAATTGYVVSCAFVLMVAPRVSCSGSPFHVPTLALSVWQALALVPLAGALVGAVLAAALRLTRCVEIRVLPDAIDVSPHVASGPSDFGWHHLEPTRVLLEQGRTLTPIPVPVKCRAEAEHVVRQIESAIRRVGAGRRGYRG